ncbi:lytic transglycosylase domain-containing protein [Desulforhopalus singaporensis]|uniref:Transglycosylase SLT domain-containing protein n=1 Tax=Desulforhopalus singaporensis TaxID=91360 RepID=A0A1H0TUM6_9BACT|nr:lytic transglycosylase domain-containing protein [Desulforhopalus singaporensis]SDP57591.1 Transglycosylase SLT domain-containing protein [Desulforhopalus singaporensis]
MNVLQLVKSYTGLRHGKGCFSGHAVSRLPFALLLTAAMIGCCCEAEAEIYICQDQSGAVSFTNVRNSPTCRPYSLDKKSRADRSWANAARTINGAQLDREIQKIGQRYGVDPPLIKAIIHTESNFNSRAVSKKGAQGLMQLMPYTARELRVRDPFNPLENIDGGTRYFRKMLNNFNGNIILSLAAYNAGPGLIRKVGGIPRNGETRQYIKKVLRRYKFYKQSWK